MNRSPRDHDFEAFKWDVLLDSAFDDVHHISYALGCLNAYALFTHLSTQERNSLTLRGLRELFEERLIYFFRTTDARAARDAFDEATWVSDDEATRMFETASNDGFRTSDLRDVWFGATGKGFERAQHPPQWLLHERDGG